MSKPRWQGNDMYWRSSFKFYSAWVNTRKFVCLIHDLEFISLNFRLEIDVNDIFESYRDCSRLKFYEIIKLTFLWKLEVPKCLELCSWRLSRMEMGEIRVLRFTWTVQTCRRGHAGRRRQAEFCLLSCRLVLSMEVKWRAGRESVWQSVETVSKISLIRTNVDKDRRPPTVDRLLTQSSSSNWNLIIYIV